MNDKSQFDFKKIKSKDILMKKTLDRDGKL